MFGHGKDVRIPRLGHQASGFVERDARIVADVRTFEAVDVVFVKQRSPFAGKIDLSKRRSAHEHCEHQRGDQRLHKIVAISCHSV